MLCIRVQGNNYYIAEYIYTIHTHTQNTHTYMYTRKRGSEWREREGGREGKREGEREGGRKGGRKERKERREREAWHANIPSHLG